MAAESNPRPRFETLAVHAGETGDTIGGAHPVAPPIVQASSFWFDSSDDLDRVLGGEQAGYVYSRFANPTVAAFETAVAALEGAPGAVAFASGMAALQAVVMALAAHPGAVVFVSQDCYGGTQALLSGVLAPRGLDVRYVDVFDVAALEARCAAERPCGLLLEAITNPLQRVVDVPAVVGAATAHGVPVVVDSTFTTPYLLRPLALGAAYVVHSATKYLGGHGDVTGGVVACASQERLVEVRALCRLGGAILAPHEAYLALRGLRTLGLRMERQCANAAALAHWLAADPRVEQVYYPGLPSSPDYAIASRQLLEGRYGAMLAFGIRGGEKAEVLRFLERLQLIKPAPTLGDIASLALYPVIASHRGLTADERAARGIHDNIVRLSVGIEHPDDLVADLDRALGAGAAG